MSATPSPNRQYLRYVMLHKFYVFRWMWLLGRPGHVSWLRWLWRSIMHDASKFGRAEWSPYVASFYGPHAQDRTTEIKDAFDRAWLHHIHANPHHWQHWILREDTGSTKVLLMPSDIAVEMLADWLSAGSKVLRRPSYGLCVAETIQWYVKARTFMQLRGPTKDYVERTLHDLAADSGLLDAAKDIRAAQLATQSIRIPGRPSVHNG